jgi:hypothetical protein
VYTDAGFDAIPAFEVTDDVVPVLGVATEGL